MIAALIQIIGASGGLWLTGAIGFTLAAACEGAKPREGQTERGFAAVLPAVAAFVAPVMLLLHAFWAVAPRQAEDINGPTQIIPVFLLLPQPTLVVLAVIGAVFLLGPSLIGMGLSRAPMLYRLSPWLNAAALVVVVFATYQSAAEVFVIALNRAA